MLPAFDKLGEDSFFFFLFFSFLQDLKSEFKYYFSYFTQKVFFESSLSNMGVKSWVFQMEEKENREISVLAFFLMVSGPKLQTEKSPFLNFILFPTVKFLFVQNVECSRSYTGCSTSSRACWGTYSYPRTPRVTDTETHSLLQKEWIHTFNPVSKEGKGRWIFTLL